MERVMIRMNEYNPYHDAKGRFTTTGGSSMIIPYKKQQGRPVVGKEKVTTASIEKGGKGQVKASVAEGKVTYKVSRDEMNMTIKGHGLSSTQMATFKAQVAIPKAISVEGKGTSISIKSMTDKKVNSDYVKFQFRDAAGFVSAAEKKQIRKEGNILGDLNVYGKKKK